LRVGAQDAARAGLVGTEERPVPEAESSYNPLGTKAQQDAELLARTLVTASSIRAATASVGQIWRAAVVPLTSQSDATFDSALRNLAFASVVGAIGSDPLRPVLLRIEVSSHEIAGVEIPGSLVAINNPDTIYRTAPLDGASAYEIHGVRYAVPPVDNNFSILTPTGATTDNLTGSQLVTNPDGTFTITIDGTPANGRPNHLRILSGPSQILIRDTIDIWATQRPNALTIQRVSGPASGPQLSIAQIEAAAISSMQTSVSAVIGVNNIINAGPINVLPQPTIRSSGGFLATQANSLGHFLLTDDEAYVATLSTGGAAYMTFPIYNVWQTQPDFVNITSSLNNEQAVPNSDGTYTFVLSVRDPGVYNWVNPNGARETITQLRWQGLPAQTPPTGGPAIISQQVVKLSKISTVLPPDTVYVTPSERRKQQRLRALSIAWRKPTG
jgi:hypothetical protein